MVLPRNQGGGGVDSHPTYRCHCVDRSAVDLSRHNGELYVTVGNYRREISLPRVLAKRDTAGATIQDGELRVRFSPRSQAAVETDAPVHTKARR